jgi:putative phage-type endonuclease
MKKIHKIEQRSNEWFELRKKYPLTASKACAIGNQGKGLETLCWEKLSEKYSSAEKDTYTNKDLARGVELEPLARDMYILETGNQVEEIGFVTDDEISTVGGASPDGEVIEKNSRGGLEIKCFDDTKHFKMIIDYKATKDFEIESGYLWQMQQQMLFTGNEWTDFLAFNPNFTESLLIKRVYKNEVMQEKIKVGLKLGEKIISEIENKLK